MEVAAKLTSKGQVTVPKAVREALDLRAGDRVVFQLREDHAVLTRTGDFLALAGCVAVPAARRNTTWDEVRRATRTARADRRR